ncbi:PucR family transcriptional regulator ligand-binding domain-containing protein [Lachnospiraceae bacterium 62-35]
MGFTVKALLSEAEFSGIYLAAGKKAVNNLIRNASVVDCPDGFDWMLPGDFILTSGYIFRDDSAMRRELIVRLSESACAGLGIKEDKYWDEIPKDMLEEADKRRLPVLAIPRHCTLSEIQKVIFRETAGREDSLLQKYFKIHRRLIASSLSEQPLDMLAAHGAELVNNPLIIVDENWKLLSYAEHQESEIPLSGYMSLVKGQKVFTRKFLETIPKDIDDFKKSIKRVCETARGPVVCSIMPVRADKDAYGYLVVWETVRKLRSIEYMGLEQAAIIIALERVKAMRIEESRHRMHRDFFSDLLEGRIESKAAAYSLASINGLDVQKNHACILVQIDRIDRGTEQKLLGNRTELEYLQPRLEKFCMEYFRMHGINVSVFFKNHHVVIILPLREGEKVSNLESYYGELVAELYIKIKEMPEKPVVMVGIGRGYKDIGDLKKSFAEAQEAIRLSGLSAYAEPVSWFEKLMVYNILSSGISHELLEEFYELSIGELASYDAENHTNLVETLETYLLENRNINIAAKKLYIHRNTMNYRINKIKQVLNTDFNDSEKLLKLQIGIKAMRIIGGFQR